MRVCRDALPVQHTPLTPDLPQAYARGAADTLSKLDAEVESQARAAYAQTALQSEGANAAQLSSVIETVRRRHFQCVCGVRLV